MICATVLALCRAFSLNYYKAYRYEACVEPSPSLLEVPAVAESLVKAMA